jgi:two-component system LytT family response regulator
MAHDPAGPATLHVLIADDEALARQALRDFIDRDASLALVAEAEDGDRAAERIDAVRPDLVFLDIRMPGLSGIEVLDRVAHRPAVIFTTAYDTFAVTAFELGAVDYLLKPFGGERFREAVARARRAIVADAAWTAAERAAESLRASGPLGRIFVRDGDRFLAIETAQITRVAGSGDYARIHVDGGSHLLPVTLTALEARLDDGRFLRIHRSHIVNLAAVREVRREDDRRLRVLLRDGSYVVASRSGSARLRTLL